MSTTEKLYKKYNLQKYWIEVRLYNPDGDEFFFNPEAILQLVIEEDIHFWPVKGFIVYENPFEIVERKLSSNDDIAGSDLDPVIKQTMIAKKSYNFRNDGRDYLTIRIKEELDTTNGPQELDAIKELPDEQWLLLYECVVYDKEDVQVNNIEQKAKKLYFWDKTYQDMLDRNIQWSTANSADNLALKSGTDYNPRQAADDDRKMYTGEAVKAILKSQNFQVDEQNFDTGATKLFYSAYHDMTMWDNIEYILAQHISAKSQTAASTDESDTCVFFQDRYDKMFKLSPLYKLFMLAGNDPNLPKEFQIEHLFLEELGSISEKAFSNKAPLLDNKLELKKDVKLHKIKTYQFVDMSAGDSTNLMVTTPVHAYDNKTKTFHVGIADSTIEGLPEKMEKIYIEGNLLTKNGPHALMSLNKMKTDNMKVNPVFSNRANKMAIKQKGFGRMLFNAVHLNECLRLQLEGATIRAPLRFLGIDRQSYSDSKFDHKLLGQWFITNVKHIFFHDIYVNELTCVKVHSYDDLQISKNVD